jgi:hypothetical protein
VQKAMLCFVLSPDIGAAGEAISDSDLPVLLSR